MFAASIITFAIKIQWLPEKLSVKFFRLVSWNCVDEGTQLSFPTKDTTEHSLWPIALPLWLEHFIDSVTPPIHPKYFSTTILSQLKNYSWTQNPKTKHEIALDIINQPKQK